MTIAKDILKSDNVAFMQSAKLFKEAMLDEQAKKIKRLEWKIAKLRKAVKSKNGVIEDVSKELTAKNKQLEDIRKKYADKVVEKIDMSALRSAETALQEKDDFIADLRVGIDSLYDMVHGDPILKMKERKETDLSEQQKKMLDDFLKSKTCRVIIFSDVYGILY